MYHRILLAADGSPSSLKAAEAAASLARLVPGSKVTVVYVLHVPAVIAPSLDVPVDAMVRNTSRPVFDTTLRVLDLPEAQVHCEVQIGDPADEIVQMARTAPFDLIVMGTRGLSTFKQILLGGVSHRVANTAPCPVLLVR